MDFSKKYLDLINGEYKGINLTRITDYEDFKLKQYLDSIYPILEISEINEIFNNFKLIVDIGFGGGFPILPLAQCFPNKKFLGFEARAKKVKVVGEIASKLSINNISLKHARVENIYFDKKVFILLKAVGNMESILDKISCANEHTFVGFYKGPEVFKLENIEIDNWDLVLKKEYLIEEKIKRSFLIYRFKKVPRGTDAEKSKKNKNSFAKLSSFL